MVVNSIIYRAGKRGEEVKIEDIGDAINESDNYVWLGVCEPDAAFMHTIQQEFGLHELAIEDALAAHQRPKIEQYGESVFMVLKTAQKNEQDEIHFGETHIFAGKNFLITVRHGASETYSPVRKRAEENKTMMAQGPGYALYCIIDFIVDHYLEVTASLGDRINEMETKMFSSEFSRSAVQNVYGLRRQLLALRNAAQPVDDICQQLIRLHEDIVPKPLRAYLRDVQDHARHAVTDAEDMREILTSAMQVNLALVSVQQNEVVKRISGWGAILVVPTVVFSMYGMNFDHMPELHTLYGYPAVVCSTMLACCGLYFGLKRSGWL